MKTRIFAAITGLAALLLAAIAIVPGVFAQASTPVAPAAPSTAQGNDNAGNGPGNGYGMGNHMNNGAGMGAGMGTMMGGAGNSLIDVAADKLGMTRTDLVTALGGTKSIAQVAGEHNVAASTIVDAFIAPRTERLDAMVTAGTLTRAQADQMLATMRTQVTEQINEVWTAKGAGPGTGYVDSDGDGVCDNMPGTGNANGNGSGNGNRMHGPGMGPNR